MSVGKVRFRLGYSVEAIRLDTLTYKLLGYSKLVISREDHKKGGE